MHGVPAPPRGTDAAHKWVSVLLGGRELHWRLPDVLRLPGLRRDTLLATDLDLQDEPYPPWTFHTSERARPMLYGYRGLVLDWDFRRAGYMVRYISVSQPFME